MIHITTRQQLIDWLVEKAQPGPYLRTIRRAITDEKGKVEVCGGFVSDPPHNSCGWIIKITTQFGKIFNVFIYFSSNNFKWKLIKEIPWLDWIGCAYSNPLYRGDFPEEYKKCCQDQLKIL